MLSVTYDVLVDPPLKIGQFHNGNNLALVEDLGGIEISTASQLF